MLPVLSGTARLAIVVVGGWFAVSLQGIYGVIALGLAVFGAATIWTVMKARW
jgi:hypothetical protein